MICRFSPLKSTCRVWDLLETQSWCYNRWCLLPPGGGNWEWNHDIMLIRKGKFQSLMVNTAFQQWKNIYNIENIRFVWGRIYKQKREAYNIIKTCSFFVKTCSVTQIFAFFKEKEGRAENILRKSKYKCCQMSLNWRNLWNSVKYCVIDS